MIDEKELAAWAAARRDACESLVLKAVYDGIVTRCSRPDGFALPDE